MLTLEELTAFLSDLESDRVERTVSTNNTDKFSEAICAFSNDFPNHQRPGYLIIVVNDQGDVTGIDVTDKVLKDLAAIRNNGQILPQPAITVNKYNIQDKSVAVVEVFPSPLTPVRYKGRTWIRNGPTKAIANEAEETRLSEKRTSHARTFDAKPAFGSTIADLNLELFKLTYLPGAVDEEVILTNHREIKQQLSSLRLYDLPFDCPTNAGIILLGNNPLYFLPGGYVQYVKYAGNSLESAVINEEAFSGDLINLMKQTDLFVKNSIEHRPVFTSPLQETMMSVYPAKAVRELLNNAIMHRSYESNAPVRFYEFADRMEIHNPGGLYGSARPDNFPNQNDYRNPVVAEALKVLGYVNKFNRGIAVAKSAAEINGNPNLVFDYQNALHFAVTLYAKT